MSEDIDWELWEKQLAGEDFEDEDEDLPGGSGVLRKTPPKPGSPGFGKETPKEEKELALT